MKHVILLILTFLTFNAYSQVFTTQASGDWSNALTWDVGVPPNDQTGNNDDININHNVTLTGDLDMKSGSAITITVGDTLTVNGNVIFNNGSAITIDDGGVLIVNGDVTNNNNSTDVNINGTIIINGNYDGGNGSELVGTGEMDISGEVSTSGNGTVFGSETDCTENCDSSNDDPLGDPLPIELVFFTAQHIDEGVRLEWLTATEVNNDYFEIEKSKDTKDWEIIGTTKGAGNSSSPLMYSFVDNQPGDGYVYYKLNQYDYDGTKYVKKMTYTYIQKGIERNIDIWPNPSNVNDDFNLEILGFNGEEILIVVMDVIGNIYYEKAVLIENDNTIVVIDSKLSPGTYLVVGSNKQELYKKKLIIK